MLTDIDYDQSKVLNPTRVDSQGEMQGEGDDGTLYEAYLGMDAEGTSTQSNMTVGNGYAMDPPSRSSTMLSGFTQA